MNGSQLEPAHASDARQLGDEASRRMVSGKLVETKRRDREDALTPRRPDQEREEVTRRAIRPMEVLDDEHHGSLARERGEQPEQQPEHPSLV